MSFAAHGRDPGGHGEDAEGESTRRVQAGAAGRRVCVQSPIEAVGGKLKIVAEFPEGEVAITNFSNVGEAEDSESSE